ncbi:hypothetical protein FB451DRAFT_319417 [Mycena latifolia]|nr:hypothetical protein FB451DRAFT_319417 [Mycena latifolia]
MPPKAPKLRPAIDNIPEVEPKSINIYHPGYNPPRLILKLFVSPLNPEENLPDSTNYGLPCDLVLDACYILANNNAGTLRLLGGQSTFPKGMLPPGDYTFSMTGQGRAYRYPLCRKFSRWTPLSSGAPPAWKFDKRVNGDNEIRRIKASSVSVLVKDHDKACLITGETDRLDCAHLVPSSEARWFTKHHFSQLAGDMRFFTVNSPNNQLTLRADISARGIDKGHFCFYPYEKNWVAFWMGDGSLQLALEHNFRVVSLPQRLRAAYLFARFAWNVFLLANEFFSAQEKTLVFVEHDDKDDDDDLSTGKAAGRSGECKKRRAAEQQAGQATKKRRLDASPDDVPDLSQVTPIVLQKMKHLDSLLEAGDLEYDEESDWYPGYSLAEELAYNYKLAHPAATDPGGARIALVSERQE